MQVCARGVYPESTASLVFEMYNLSSCTKQEKSSWNTFLYNKKLEATEKQTLGFGQGEL